eukprot:c42635_g1_i1.p3 GENE.c42635_g1_i1~~c42635_g1_i1.p3  ORF type:complete len:173 (+),score=10.10 c42635_g1_i1:110-628(+)
MVVVHPPSGRSRRTLARWFMIVLLCEAGLNVITACMCLFAPHSFTAPFDKTAPHGFFAELCRWYGVFLLALAYGSPRMILSRSLDGLRAFVECLLFGDFIHLLVSIYMVSTLAVVSTFAVVFMFLVTIGLAGARSYWLYTVWPPVEERGACESYSFDFSERSLLDSSTPSIK